MQTFSHIKSLRTEFILTAQICTISPVGVGGDFLVPREFLMQGNILPGNGSPVVRGSAAYASFASFISAAELCVELHSFNGTHNRERVA